MQVTRLAGRFSLGAAWVLSVYCGAYPFLEAGHELIRATRGAHNALLDLEELGDRDLQIFRARYEKLAEAARELIAKGEMDTESPEA